MHHFRRKFSELLRRWASPHWEGTYILGLQWRSTRRTTKTVCQFSRQNRCQIVTQSTRHMWPVGHVTSWLASGGTSVATQFMRLFQFSRNPHWWLVVRFLIDRISSRREEARRRKWVRPVTIASLASFPRSRTRSSTVSLRPRALPVVQITNIRPVQPVATCRQSPCAHKPAARKLATRQLLGAS